MTPSEIIATIRAHYGLTRNIDFAKRMGLSPQNAQVYGQRQSLDYDLIHEKFPEISAEWLLSHGEKGSMISGVEQSINGTGHVIAGHDVNNYGDAEWVAATIEGLRTALLNEQENSKKLRNYIDRLFALLEKCGEQQETV